MKKLHFSREKKELLDSEGNIFTGRRFDVVEVSDFVTSSSRDDATEKVRLKLEDLAEKKGAAAYEITSASTFDSGMEYDSRPYTAQMTAFLYR